MCDDRSVIAHYCSNELVPLLRGGERTRGMFRREQGIADTAFGVDRVGIRLYIGDQFQVDERSTALSAAMSAGFDSPSGL